nr:uncharacterized protein LOC108079465 [Drosophila kikkawai]
MRAKDDQQLHDLINKESIAENKKTYNLRRKPVRNYNVGDLVAIKRTQFGGGLKLKPKYLGPYEIVKVKHNNAYDVQKVGNSDGPKNSSTCAEYLKPWSIHDANDKEDDETFEANV